MAGLWDKFKTDYDPQMVGIGLLSGIGSGNTGASLGQALLMGRQQRLQEAQDAAAARAAERKQKIEMTDKGIYETGDGFGKRTTINTPTGVVLQQDYNPYGEVSTQPIYTPPEKKEKPDVGKWVPLRDTVDGNVVVINDLTGEQKVLGKGEQPAAGAAPGGRPGGKLDKATTALVNSAVNPEAATRFKQLVQDPERTAGLSGPEAALTTGAANLLRIPTKAGGDANIWNAFSSDAILAEVSKLAPATDTDVQLIANMKTPQIGDRASGIRFYNDVMAARKRILEKYAPEALNDPRMIEALTPIPEEGKAAPSGNKQEPKFLGFE